MLDIKNMSTDEIANYDFSSLSKSEKQEVIKQLQTEASIFKTKEQANKLVLNSIYGAMANRFSYFYDKDLAEAITIQGQDAIRYSEKIINYYFNNLFHKDTKLLLELQKIDNSINITPNPVKKPVTVYMDTDSVHKDTIITTDSGKFTIEQLYNNSNKSAGETINGHESVSTNLKVLNWSEEKGTYYANVKRVIRHKVTKQQWKLKTKSGKEVIVTNDHSMIVFRNGKKIEVKPCEITKTDKILYID